MSSTYDSTLWQRARDTRHVQPSYLRDKPVGEVFWENKRLQSLELNDSLSSTLSADNAENAGNRGSGLNISSMSSGKNNLFQSKTYGSQFWYQVHRTPAGLSKYLGNRRQCYDGSYDLMNNNQQMLQRMGKSVSYNNNGGGTGNSTPTGQRSMSADPVTKSASSSSILKKSDNHNILQPQIPHLGPIWDSESTKGIYDITRRGGFNSSSSHYYDHNHVGGFLKTLRSQSMSSDYSPSQGASPYGATGASPSPTSYTGLASIRRDIDAIRAGAFRPDKKEGKRTVPKNASHHIAARHVITQDNTFAELPPSPNDEMASLGDGNQQRFAGSEPLITQTPATGWMPPAVQVNYNHQGTGTSEGGQSGGLSPTLRNDMTYKIEKQDWSSRNLDRDNSTPMSNQGLLGPQKRSDPTNVYNKPLDSEIVDRNSKLVNATVNATVGVNSNRKNVTMDPGYSKSQGYGSYIEDANGPGSESGGPKRRDSGRGLIDQNAFLAENIRGEMGIPRLSSIKNLG